jgi:hypothetical protein
MSTYPEEFGDRWRREDAYAGRVVPVRVKAALFRFSPLARKILPKGAQRFFHLRILGSNRPYASLYHLESRRWLERDLLPWLARHHGQILFVGTSSYTYRYEKLFRPDQYTTIDAQPRCAVWGARDHIVGPIEEIARHRPRGHFGCIIVNGVFGFGVDDARHMGLVIEALHHALAPRGLLIVGWNTDLHDDPAPLLAPYFAPNGEEPWQKRRTFPPETHVNDFYVRRSDQ